MVTEKKPVSLKALAEGKAEGVQKATYFKLHPGVIEFEPGWNLRTEGPELDAHIDSLYRAMKAGAYIPPVDVIVVDGRVIARDGHCRTRAANRLVAEGIEYALEARHFRGNDSDGVYHMLGTAQGKPLPPLEAGRGYLRLLRYGDAAPAIAARLGVSETTIGNGLILAEAPRELQAMIERNEVAAHVAVAMIRQHGAKALGVLQDKLGKAKQAGASKVTAKHVSDRLPPKAIKAVTGVVFGLRASIEAAGVRVVSIEKAHDDDMVAIPAKHLKALLALTGKAEA
jgi:hypothetical protein